MVIESFSNVAFLGRFTKKRKPGLDKRGPAVVEKDTRYFAKSIFFTPPKLPADNLQK
jgi:hypothetical protein